MNKPLTKRLKNDTVQEVIGTVTLNLLNTDIRHQIFKDFTSLIFFVSHCWWHPLSSLSHTRALPLHFTLRC